MILLPDFANITCWTAQCERCAGILTDLIRATSPEMSRTFSPCKDRIRRLLQTQISSSLQGIPCDLRTYQQVDPKAPSGVQPEVILHWNKTDVLVLPDIDIPTCTVSPYLPTMSPGPSSDSEDIDTTYHPTSPVSSPSSDVQLD